MTSPSDPQLEKLRAVVGCIMYRPNWTLYVDWFTGSGRRDAKAEERIYYLSTTIRTRDAVTGESVTVEGRRWLLSPYSCESEIVQTALMAIMAAEEHEARERFRYKGVRVFNPHIDVKWLLNNQEESR